MGYLLFILFIFLFIALGVVISKDSQDFTKRKKISIIAVLALIIGLGVIYTQLQNKDSQTLVDLQSRFERLETLTCNFEDKEIAVHKKDFDVTSGIKSFVGRKGSEYEGVSVLFSSCRI